MQFYYGSQMPLRVLDETEFWKENEAEHTVVMRELVTDLEDTYVDDLKRWEAELNASHQHVKRFIESVIRSHNHISPTLHQQVLDLVSFSLQESEAFIKLCRQIKNDSSAVNQTAKVVIDHIIEESEYFIGVAQTVLYEQQ